MRTIPDALAAHLDGQATTTCHAWRVTRRDGVVFGFTDHDGDLTFAGTTFRAATGYEASEAESELGLAVATSDVAGAFSDAAITEADLRAGRFDGAEVAVFLVNWAAPESHMLLRTQEIGEVSGDGHAFNAELRGLANRLEQVQGRVYARRCDAELGDARCRVNLDDPAFRGNGTVSTSGVDTCRVTGLNAFADRWFRGGRLVFTDGANAGLSVAIEDQVGDGEETILSFWTPLSAPPDAGDAFTVTAGCDKTFTTCGAKFANRLNFCGFPHLPGSDFAYGYADAHTVHDGRPLVG
ncbi:DUF2163 domain-containing protein [Pararhizobium mangrovi]|uniref:DUF2163 domain-containing protein n=1 Tax=Pararhizobium mangrovi TaxID=2590452 RepID=A0A506UHH2_9HYPH|nr:DUF2163 domain-containing protein [Pararhizobium mangrovi]TPW32764.1 DUF2163 domain-containing protein [Pararhizobium mangrovi]